MNTAVEKVTAGELAPASVYEVFAQMARDPSIDLARIAGLMELQIKAEDRQAEKEFIAAFARLKFPPIKKLAKGQNGTKYAAWDQVQEIITPILDGEGFTLSFGSGHVTDKGLVPIEVTLSHVGGHKETKFLELPMDKSGQMTAIQGGGSTFSYGKRYAAGMILNLRFVGEDDDGTAISALTDEQRANIEDFFQDPAKVETAIGPQYLDAFLKFMGAKAISDLARVQYASAINYLSAKRRQLAEKAK